MGMDVKTRICVTYRLIRASVLFMGHMQTVEIQIRHRIMWCLIRNVTVCLHNFYNNWGKIPHNTPKLEMDAPIDSSGKFHSA